MEKIVFCLAVPQQGIPWNVSKVVEHELTPRQTDLFPRGYMALKSMSYAACQIVTTHKGRLDGVVKNSFRKDTMASIIHGSRSASFGSELDREKDHL